MQIFDRMGVDASKPHIVLGSLWLSHQILVDHTCRGLFWALYSIPLAYTFIFMSQLCCFDYHSFVIECEIKKCDALSFVPFLFFRIVSVIQGLLWFHTNLGIVFFYSCEKCLWNFNKNCSESIDGFRQYGQFSNVNSCNS